MKHFFNSSTKHTTTALMLVVWLFALASGIANACLLEEARGTHAHAAGTEQSSHTHLIATRSAQGTDIDDNIDESPTFKALCLDACDGRSNVLLKQDASEDQPLLAPMALFAISWRANQPVESTVRLDRDRHADPFGIPIRVRYSRLTL